MNVTDIWQKVNAVHCYSCGITTEMIIPDLTDEEQFEDAAYELAGCCDDPSLSALIISDEKIEDLDTNHDEFWHFGQKRYEYSVDEVIQ